MLRAGKVAVFPEGVLAERSSGRRGAPPTWRWCQARPLSRSPFSELANLGSTRTSTPLGQTDPRCLRRAIQRTPIFLATPQAAVAEWTEVVRQRLADHVVAAQAVTGLPLPGPPKIKSALSTLISSRHRPRSQAKRT